MSICGLHLSKLFISAAVLPSLQCNRRHQTLPRSGAAPGESVWVYSFLRRLFLTVMCKYHIIHKPDVHNISKRRQRRNELRPYVAHTGKLVEFKRAVPEIRMRICMRLHRDRQTFFAYRNTPLPCKVKRSIAIRNTPHRYRNSHAIRNHTVLPATRQRWHSRPYSSRSWYSIKRPRPGMQGWVDLVGC